MIKEALEYIVGLKTPVITEIDDNTYSDKPLNRISYVPYAKTIGMKTLTSLVEYIKANIDCMSEKMIVHVVSPTEVHLYSSLDADRKREHLVEVNAELPDFRFGNKELNDGQELKYSDVYKRSPRRKRFALADAPGRVLLVFQFCNRFEAQVGAADGNGISVSQRSVLR